MNQNSHFDIIIAGGGAFGLSLLWHLMNSDSLNSKKILLLDQCLKPDNSKTWCFWDDGSFLIQDTIYHTWKNIRFQSKFAELTESLQEYRYHCVRSLDFTEKILSIASDQPNITLLESNISDFEYSRLNDTAMVHSTAGTFTAPVIFQSALKPKDYDQQISDISLSQHFLGWEIEVNEPLFNPNEATLMDFEVTQEYGFAFMYILPFSETHALIEFTLFTDHILNRNQYETVLNSYLSKKYGLESQNYSIARKEFGNIPMEDRRYNTFYCKNVYNCGTAGGYTKPSTGYTFRRIQKQCLKILSDLENDRPVRVQPVSSYRFRVYDMMLLYNLKHDHNGSLKIFHDLFSKNRFDKVFKFLDEKTSFDEELSIFTSFSPVPFLNSIYRMKHRIFKGA